MQAQLTDIQEDDENKDTSNIIDLDLNQFKRPSIMDIINKVSSPVEADNKPFVANINASAQSNALKEAYSDAKNDKYSTLFETEEQIATKKSSIPDIKIVSYIEMYVFNAFYMHTYRLARNFLFYLSFYLIYSGLSGFL